MAELFGFKFERLKDSGSQEKFTEPSSEDGTLEVAGGGFYGQLLDTDGRERTEMDLVRRYRDIAQQPECDSAIEDIINEGIVANSISHGHSFNQSIHANHEIPHGIQAFNDRHSYFGKSSRVCVS